MHAADQSIVFEMSETELSGTILDGLLKSVDDGTFKKSCEKIGVNENVAIDNLVAKFPKKAESIVKRIIGETDPVDIDSIHIGNYSQKANVISIINKIDLINSGKSSIKLHNHVLIFGDPGVGKTSFVYTLSREYEIIDVNASKDRTRDGLANEIQGVSRTESLLGKKKLIFFDEIDSMSKSGYDLLVELIGPGADDVKSILDTMKTISDEKKKPTASQRKVIEKMMLSVSIRSRFPIVMACNEIKNVSERIKQSDRVRMIKFSSPSVFEIEALLIAYAEKYWDGINHERNAKLHKTAMQIKRISIDCNGDVRNAKSMLLGSSAVDKEEDLRILDIVYMVFVLDDRNKVYETINGMKYSFSTLLSCMMINITRYYNKMSEINNIANILSFIDTIKYKVRREYVCGIIAYGITPSRFKELTPLYPKITTKKSGYHGKEKENENE